MFFFLKFKNLNEEAVIEWRFLEVWLKWKDNGQRESCRGVWNLQSTCYLLTRYCLFVSVRFNRFVQDGAANSCSMEMSIRTSGARAHTSKKKRITVVVFYLKMVFMFSCSCCCVCSPGAVQPARQVQETKNCLYEPAAAGVGAPVQAEQVPVTTQALRSGDVTHADRNSGIQEYVLFVFSTCVTYVLE